MRAKAARIIADFASTLAGVNTKSPYSASKYFDKVFDDVKTGRLVAPNVISSRSMARHKYTADDERAQDMVSNILHNDTVELNHVYVRREKRFYTVRWVDGRPNVAQAIKDPHTVDYVLCHIKGYRKYILQHANMPIYVKGRDIIITSTLMATRPIIEMMKKEIKGLLNGS